MAYNHGARLTTTFKRLAGKVILIAGASSGIGAAAARLFAREGATVVCLARRKEMLLDLAGELNDAGFQAMAIPCDITDEAAVAEAVANAVDAYGRLDGAFNNAGHGPAPGPLHKMEMEAVDRVFNTNFRGTFICMKYEIAAMLDRGIRGSIVNTSSIAALVGMKGNSGYAPSKWAVVGLTKCAALDYAPHGIRVNTIAPGGTRTEMFERGFPTEEARERVASTSPMNHIAHPDDIARAALFLLSDDARWITGAVLPCEGGMSAGVHFDLKALIQK
jgi:NAD(P)-dependent dehydrogenase (short-subunit alcohol dehydrogenase family)